MSRGDKRIEPVEPHDKVREHNGIVELRQHRTEEARSGCVQGMISRGEGNWKNMKKYTINYL